VPSLDPLAGLDPVEGLLELLLVVADLGERELEADLVVVGHDGEPVGGRQAPREVGGGGLRGLELVALHRARSVDHEREVQGTALGGGGLGRGELEEAMHAVLALDGEELVVQAHAGAEVVRGHGPVLLPTAAGRRAETFRGPTARCDIPHSKDRL
jgi:hypothetical protein